MPETRCTSASRFKLRRSERIQPTAQAVGSKAAPLNEPRRGERQKLGRARLQSCRATVSEAEDQTSKLTHFSNSPLHFFPSICYKQFTESRCVASRRICCISRHRPASKIQRERVEFSIVPATGLHSESNWFRTNRSEGYLQSKDLQASVLFSISCLPYRAAQNARRNWRFYPGRKAILSRASERR